jgi:hypothetical protein
MIDPLPVGAVKETVTEVESITVAETLVGALGLVYTIDDAVDELDVPPEEFVAVIVNV